MSAPRFQVEAVQGSVAIFGEPLLPTLPQTLENAGLEVLQSSYTTLLTNLSNLPHADSYLVSLTPQTATYFLGEGSPIWKTFTTYPHPHIYFLERAWQHIPLETDDHCTRIVLGEYLDNTGEGSPTLTTLKTQAKTGFVLAGAGLNLLHLMSEDFVTRALSVLICANVRSPVVHIGNPDGVSLSTIAQTLLDTNQLAHSPSYQNTGLTPIVGPNFYQTTHSLLEKIPAESTLELVKKSFDLPLKVVSETQPVKPNKNTLPPPMPTPRKTLAHLSLAEPVDRDSPPTRITNLRNLEFVPLNKNRPKLVVKLRKPKFRLNSSLRLVLRGLLLGLFFYLSSIFLTFGITYVTLRHLLSGNYTVMVNNQIAKASGNYLYINATALNLKVVIPLLDAYQQGFTLADTSSALLHSLGGISRYVLASENLNIASSISDSRRLIEDLYQQLSLFDAALPTDTPKLLSNYDHEYQNLKTTLPNLRKNILVSKGVLSVLPNVLSLEDRTKYLILFQNNMELRATGGFIGSYGLLSLEKGRLYDFQVYDVYSADGSLKGHVDPPLPIKNILGEANWYLRDSNFDPDFPTSARRAEWFLKKSTNTDVSGTISLNLQTLKSILNTLGPLDLPDYQEKITSDNLAERAQYHAEVNFFPGSTAKKEFLSSIANNLFTKIKTLDTDTLLKLGRALFESLESNDTQISLVAESTDLTFKTLGWSGALENKPCPTSPCYDDYLMSVDSNFGVNKANFYISRNSNISIKLSKDGYPTTSVTTTWTNTATSNAWPAGAYKNYHRVYLPTFVEVESVAINDRVLPSSEYTISQEHGRTIVGYLVTVPINTSLTSTITYKSTTNLKNSMLYSLYLQRQSGTRPEDKVNISLEFPQYLKPLKLSPSPSESSPQKLNFVFSADADHRLSVQF